MSNRLENVLRDIIKAWEHLKGDKNYSPTQIAEWLVDDMKPAIDKARKVLGLKIPEDK